MASPSAVSSQSASSPAHPLTLRRTLSSRDNGELADAKLGAFEQLLDISLKSATVDAPEAKDDSLTPVAAEDLTAKKSVDESKPKEEESEEEESEETAPSAPVTVTAAVETLKPIEEVTTQGDESNQVITTEAVEKVEEVSSDSSEVVVQATTKKTTNESDQSQFQLDAGDEQVTVAQETEEKVLVDDQAESTKVVASEEQVVAQTTSSVHEEDGRGRRKENDDPGQHQVVANQQTEDRSASLTDRSPIVDSKPKDDAAAVIGPTGPQQNTQTDEAPRSGRRGRRERNSGNPNEAIGATRAALQEASRGENAAKETSKVESAVASAPTSSTPITQPDPVSATTTTPPIAVAVPTATATASAQGATDGAQARTAPGRGDIGSISGPSSSSSTRSQAAAAPQTESSKVDQRQQIRLIQRVARGFDRIGENGGQIRLRLHPPELGSLTMMVRIQGKNVTAQLSTETPEARQVLLDNLPQLKQQLADRGLEVQRFDVEVANQGLDLGQNSSGSSSGSASSGGAFQNPDQTSNPYRDTWPQREAATRLDSRTSTSAGFVSSRSIDLQV